MGKNPCARTAGLRQGGRLALTPLTRSNRSNARPRGRALRFVWSRKCRRARLGLMPKTDLSSFLAFLACGGNFRDVIGLIATRDRCGTYSPAGARVCATIGRKRSASGGKTRNDRAHLEILSQTGRHACAWHAAIARCLRFPRAGGMRCVRHRPAGRGDGQSGPGHGTAGLGPRKSDVSAHPGKVGRGARRACPRDRRAGDGAVVGIHWVGR